MLGDGGLGLADADGLDQDDVVAGGLDTTIASRVALATPPSVPAVGRGADERGRVDGQPRHPGLVAEDAAAGAAATTGRRRAPRPGARAPVSGVPSASMKVDLPTPGTPVMPTRRARRRAASSSTSSSWAALAVVGAGATRPA